jgi:post-segregation antitoxin (ccd killing protein)
MPEIFDVVNTQGLKLVSGIQNNIAAAGQNATGKTAQSLRIETKQEGTKVTMQLFGRPFFMTVQTGRRPTPDKKPSREMIDNIKEWVNARGISESAVWAIATNIQKKGTQLWREGGREDIVDPAVDNFVNDVAQEFLKAEADNFVLKLRQMKWSQ